MISISGLNVRFGRKRALNGVDLTIDKGQCIMLAGANGSGKTTLLRSVAGVLRMNEGSVRVDNVPVGRKTRFKTAYIPASLSFYDSLSIGDAIKLHRSFYSDFDYRELGKVRFAKQLKTGSLSRGEKTIFFLSLALATSPDYLLIDDVIHFLDPYLREVFLNIIMQLIEEQQLSVVIAAQSAADIEGVLERVIVMDRGKMVLDDSVESLKQSFVRVYSQEAPMHGEQKLPVVFERDWEGIKEMYIYPLPNGVTPAGRLDYLNLNEILRAFIGGEYDSN